MALNLITGYAGIPHITSENDGAVNAALYGSERYVLNTGEKFAYEIISNNLIRIKDGYAMNQGRKIGLAISEYEDLTIDNGLQGVKRSDIIVIRYKKNLDTGIESAYFVVVKGTSGDTYKDPALETGNIIQGDSVDDLPLYRVKIDGLSIATVEPMFNVLMSMQEMQEELTELNGNMDYIRGEGFGIGDIYCYDDKSHYSAFSFTGARGMNATPAQVIDGVKLLLSQTDYISSGDINSLITGIYWINGYGTISNSPFTNTHYILIAGGNGTSMSFQLAIDHASHSIKTRTYTNGSWGSWG